MKPLHFIESLNYFRDYLEKEWKWVLI
jgi:hypothetical protein